MACKNAYIINGRPYVILNSYFILGAILLTPSLRRPPHITTTFGSDPLVVALESLYCIDKCPDCHVV